jgi:hypothetical protein
MPKGDNNGYQDFTQGRKGGILRKPRCNHCGKIIYKKDGMHLIEILTAEEETYFTGFYHWKCQPKLAEEYKTFEKAH